MRYAFHMTDEESAAEVPAPTWREQAVARSLDSARLRAESRLQRFLDAAFELINTGGNDFTVQEVVERSGQSLRSFYQYFGGKQELLLALFEESVRSTAERLRERVYREPDAVERLHTFVVEYYRLCRQVRPGKPTKNTPAPMLVEFAQQLLTSQPKEAARAFGPLVTLFDEVFTEAAATGGIRSDIGQRRVAGVILEAIMFNVFSATIGGEPLDGAGVDPAEELWDLLLNGMRGTPA
jgi:AcrR family transcriptional regulator